MCVMKFLNRFHLEWAIPEINSTPPIEELGTPKCLDHFCRGNSKKNMYFFSTGTEELRIPKNFGLFLGIALGIQKNIRHEWKSQF